MNELIVNALLGVVAVIVGLGGIGLVGALWSMGRQHNRTD
jgi:hypothetical protein